MKVGILSSCLYSVPPKGVHYSDGSFHGGYGGESQVYSLVRALNREGVEVELFAVAGSQAPEKGTLHYTPQGDWNTVWDLEARVTSLYRNELESCDIVHDWSLTKKFHHNAYNDGKKCIMTPWGTNAPTWFRRHNTVLWSSFQRGLFLNQGYPQSTKFVWGGVDPGMFEPRYEAGEYFLYLSRIHPSKRSEDVAGLAMKMGFPLVIACDTESPDHAFFLQQIMQKTAKYPNVSYVVDPTFEQKVELYARAKALILPSMSECFGLVIVEAFACGTPVVVSRDGAYPEIVEQGVTGFLCSTPAQFEAAVRNVGVLERKRCREVVENTFNSGRVAQEYIDIYRRVIDGDSF